MTIQWVRDPVTWAVGENPPSQRHRKDKKSWKTHFPGMSSIKATFILPEINWRNQDNEGNEFNTKLVFLWSDLTFVLNAIVNKILKKLLPQQGRKWTHLGDNIRELGTWMGKTSKQNIPMLHERALVALDKTYMLEIDEVKIMWSGKLLSQKATLLLMKFDIEMLVKSLHKVVSGNVWTCKGNPKFIHLK